VELVPRTTAPAHATGVVEFVPLAAVSADATFRLRAEGDVAALAGSIARLGQLSPVELRTLPGAVEAGGARYQVVAGFRRLAAVRLLARGRVLARVHVRLDDDDAWSLSLADALLGEPLSVIELGSLGERLAAAGVAPWAEELLEEALVRAPVDPAQREQFLAFLQGATPPAAVPAEPDPVAQDAAGDAAAEEGPEEVTPAELAVAVASGLWSVGQDLDLAVDAWGDLPEHERRQILDQLRYLAELHAFLAGARP
jgi:ParB-like chromosome segregation protein Spo0J